MENTTQNSLFALFWSFFKIGLFTFGGGYAMLPLIQKEMIDRRKWIDAQQFVDLLTLAQSSPGPIAVNTSVFIGYKMRGLRGALAAILGVVLPSFCIILLIALFFANIRHNKIVEAAFLGMRPAVVALILVPILTMSKGLRLPMLGVIVVTALLVWGIELSPVYPLIIGALGGILWTYHLSKKAQR
ncbi:MAG: chromate transporter [Alistipes sp.]